MDTFISQPESIKNTINISSSYAINIRSSSNSTPKKICQLTFNHYPEYKSKQSVFKTKNKLYFISSIYSFRKHFHSLSIQKRDWNI